MCSVSLGPEGEDCSTRGWVHDSVVYKAQGWQRGVSGKPAAPRVSVAAPREVRGFGAPHTLQVRLEAFSRWELLPPV